MKEEKSTRNGSRIAFYALSIGAIMLPIYDNAKIGEFSIYYLRFQICLFILIMYLLINVVGLIGKK